MTPGTNSETLDEVLDSVIIALKDQSWQFKPVSRKYIPKANGKLRPFGVQKIIQKGIEMILLAIYEPLFLDYSQGSCHSALRWIRTTWSGIKWVIEGDIEGCYDNVNHSILIEILRRKIQDERFLNLIRSGYEEEGLRKAELFHQSYPTFTSMS